MLKVAAVLAAVVAVATAGGDYSYTWIGSRRVRDLTTPEYQNLDLAGCKSIVRANSGFYFDGSDTGVGRGIQLTPCTQPGGCLCVKPARCNNRRRKSCNKILKCNDTKNKGRCFRFADCRRRLAFDQELVINLPSSCATEALATANRKQLFDEVRDSLLACTPACNIGPYYPENIPVDDSDTFRVQLANRYSLEKILRCMEKKEISITGCPFGSVEAEEPDSGETPLYDRNARSAGFDTCDCEDFENEPMACAPDGTQYENSCVASCSGVYATPALCPDL